MLRPARADDVDAAVPLIYSSGPDTFDYVFGDVEVFLRKSFRDGAGQFGYRNHTVAELDGRVVGIGAAYSGDASLSFTVAAARQIIRHYGVRAAAPIVRGLRVERVIRPPAKDMQYIGNLGVAEPMRGRRIGSTLIERFLEDGRAAGRRTAGLDVAVTNPKAQKLYERIGFEVTAERSGGMSNAHGTVADHRRMTIALC